MYWKNGVVKIELGVGKGKVASDKRADLKERAVRRETDREIARFNRKTRLIGNACQHSRMRGFLRVVFRAGSRRKTMSRLTL